MPTGGSEYFEQIPMVWHKIVRVGCGCFAFGFFPLVYGYLVPYYVLPELLEKNPMGVARNFQKDN